MKNSLMQLGVRSADGALDVFRDGNVVTIVARGSAVRETEHGQVRTNGVITQQYDSITAYEADRQELLERYPLAYVAIVNRLNIKDDVRRAPRLPESLKTLLPKRLPPGVGVETSGGETSNDANVNANGSRPFLALLTAGK